MLDIITTVMLGLFGAAVIAFAVMVFTSDDDSSGDDDA